MNIPTLCGGLIACLVLAGARADGIDTCSTSGFAIPDGSVQGGVTDLPVTGGPDPLVVVSARLELELEHPWVGDLQVRLIAPDGTTVDVLDRAGRVPFGFPGPFGCGGDDVLASFEDAAAESVNDLCTISGTPVFAGSMRPQNPLAGVQGVDPVGLWRVRVSDLQAGDAGTFVSACLRLEVATDCDGDGLPDDCACSADLDGDGTVGGSDLAALLAAWATAGSDADLDGDGTVGGSDLSVLLGFWGDCG